VAHQCGRIQHGLKHTRARVTCPAHTPAGCGHSGAPLGGHPSSPATPPVNARALRTKSCVWYTPVDGNTRTRQPAAEGAGRPQPAAGQGQAPSAGGTCINHSMHRASGGGGVSSSWCAMPLTRHAVRAPRRTRLVNTKAAASRATQHGSCPLQGTHASIPHTRCHTHTHTHTHTHMHIHNRPAPSTVADAGTTGEHARARATAPRIHHRRARAPHCCGRLRATTQGAEHARGRAPPPPRPSQQADCTRPPKPCQTIHVETQAQVQLHGRGASRRLGAKRGRSRQPAWLLRGCMHCSPRCTRARAYAAGWRLSCAACLQAAQSHTSAPCAHAARGARAPTRAHAHAHARAHALALRHAHAARLSPVLSS
jgi:hypothetical protein